VWRESKVIRLLSIIHNRIILDLVCGFGGSVGEDVRAVFPFFSFSGEKGQTIYFFRGVVRSDDSG